ncbi:MAG TPA: lipid-binding SYLF domain-containing protein [Methylomirabilota bacterium]|nr:lipid-binding SYLF domain-containing protein [Methylomirabilota bacterium]
MRTKSRHRVHLAALAVLVVGVARADAQSPELAASFARATTALYEMINVPDGKGIPREALAKAYAVAVFPGVVKGALLIGGTSGDGVVTAHRADGAWSPPAILRMSGGSLGIQVGAEITDVVLLIMTPKGLQGLLSSEFTIGADMSAAAGPTGARSELSTDLKFTTDLVTYSRTRGLFAGLSFSGASVRAADDWNHSLYNRGYTIQEILLGTQLPVPQVAQGFIQTVTASAGPVATKQ